LQRLLIVMMTMGIRTHLLADVLQHEGFDVGPALAAGTFRRLSQFDASQAQGTARFDLVLLDLICFGPGRIGCLPPSAPL